MKRTRQNIIRLITLTLLFAAVLLPSQPARADTRPQISVTARPTGVLWMRVGPGTGYSAMAVVDAGQPLPVLGRTSNYFWLYVTDGDNTGWIAAWLCDVNGDLRALPITDLKGVKGTAPAVPVSLPTPTSVPISVGLPPATLPFMLGGQTHTLSRPDLMHASGMTWAKLQQQWAPDHDPAAVGPRIQAAHANGLRALVSVTGYPNPNASIDYTAYVSYVAGVAALGADAIEVWNEPNYWVEWPDGQVDPGLYVREMLAPAYRAIKSANPSTMVISGGLGPNGFNQPGHILADNLYLAGMRASGAADVLDCVGIHHNAGATAPDASSGHPADNGLGHHSWYLVPQLNVVKNIFPDRPVCITEIGYLSPDGYSWLGDRFGWAAGTDINEHAAWLGQAARIARADSQIKMMVVFNVDINYYYGDDPQAGYAILRPDGSCPACVTLAAAMQ